MNQHVIDKQTDDMLFLEDERALWQFHNSTDKDSLMTYHNRQNSQWW